MEKVRPIPAVGEKVKMLQLQPALLPFAALAIFGDDQTYSLRDFADLPCRTRNVRF